MHSLAVFAIAALAYLGTTAGAPAQERKILSPRDSVFLSLDTNTISVNYGRPSIRGRKIMGGLVPWGEVWRTGANLATHLKTNFDMTLGSVPVPRGTYTLWTIPSPNDWKIVVNKQTGQWGTRYDERQDLARFAVTSEALPSTVDTFTINLSSTGKTSGVMTLMWEKTRVTIPFAKNDKIRPLSPGDSTEISLGTVRMKIIYSQPYMRGRTIWGVVVPMDSVWRTGANAATTLTTTGDIMMGTLRIPKGTYSIYSLPSSAAYHLIINKRPGGRAEYDAKQDLGSVALSKEQPASVIDPFRIWFEPSGNNAATLRLGWGDRVYSTRVTLP